MYREGVPRCSFILLQNSLGFCYPETNIYNFVQSDDPHLIQQQYMSPRQRRRTVSSSSDPAEQLKQVYRKVAFVSRVSIV